MAAVSRISSRAASVTIMLAGSAVLTVAMAQSSAKPNVDSMIDEVLKQKRSSQGNSARTAAPVAAPTAAGAGMTAKEIEAVRDKIRPCWNFLRKGSKVAIRVEVGSDAVPVKAEIVDKARYANDKDFRADADAVHRAVMNPRCQPWPLSPEKYDSWRIITFNFYDY
jgi:hypothetical protein